MKKILILQNKILHYNKSLYNYLSDVYDVTVLHSGKISRTNEDKYKEIIVKTINIGPFVVQDKVLKEVKSLEYNVVIGMFDIKWINNILALYLKNKQTKFIWWGIGYGNNKFGNCLRNYLVRKSDAIILYSKRDFNNFISKIKEDKVFIANNTFDVGIAVQSYKYDKKYLLFVGSINKRKQLDITLKAFKNIQNEIPNDINFIIIGSGKEKENLYKFIKEQKLEERVIFKGGIEDNHLLEKYYQNAIVSISFGQAGLSVLQSFGYGVPFLTKYNAISGGEITNILHNINGILCEDNIFSLEESLIRVCNDIDFAKKLGENAYYYYKNNCTIKQMIDGFTKAIEG